MPTVAVPSLTQVSVKENIAYYSGELTSEGVDALILAIKSATSQIDTLHINSRGGDIKFGMQLGRFVFDNRLNLVVNERCMSSCANYVFTAASSKIIGKHGLIGFHGGARSSELTNEGIAELLTEVPEEFRIEAEAQLKKQLKINAGHETTFFEYIGVDHRIVSYGQFKQYSQLMDKYWGWYYSFSELEKFGVTNVSLANSSWEYNELDPNKPLFEITDVDLTEEN